GRRRSFPPVVRPPGDRPRRGWRPTAASRGPRRGPGPARQRTRNSRRRGGRKLRPARRSARPGHGSRLAASVLLGAWLVVAEERPPLARDGVSHRTQDRELAARDLCDEPAGALLLELSAGRPRAGPTAPTRPAVAGRPAHA